MAPKGEYKVHSLSKHIENTKKGLAADAQFNRHRPSGAPVVKKDPESFDPNHIFAANDDGKDESDSESSSSSSDDESPMSFLGKLGVTKTSAPTPSRRLNNKDVEIADSDVERNATSKPKSTNKPIKPQPESEDSSSDSSSSSSESESEDDEPSTPTRTKPAESSSEESSEDESESDAQPKSNAKALVNGKTTAAADSSSESSESESEDEPAPAKAKAAPATKPAEPESDSSEEEDSDDEMADESMHIDQRQISKPAIPNFIAPDFVLRKGEDGANGKDVADICSKASLEGKQFWYFTVPSNIPISVVQNLEIPMDSTQQGNSVFSHDGEDYGISFESIAPKGNIQILIPSSDGSQYRSGKFLRHHLLQ